MTSNFCWFLGIYRIYCYSCSKKISNLYLFINNNYHITVQNSKYDYLIPWIWKTFQICITFIIMTLHNFFGMSNYVCLMTICYGIFDCWFVIPQHIYFAWFSQVTSHYTYDICPICFDACWLFDMVYLLLICNSN